jgi:predicted ATPase
VGVFTAFHHVNALLNFLRSLPQKKLRHLKVEISARLTSLEGANIVKKSQLAEGQTAHRVKQAC